ncbi:MAG: SCO6880 family protein [Acidimicrobiales bacterium]
MTEESTRYQLGPRSRRGLVAGWRGGQLAAVGAGLVAGVLLLRSLGGAAGAVSAFVLVAVSVAFATWPLAGRSAEQWTPVVASHLARQAGVSRGRHTALSTLELDEIPIGVAGRRIGVVVDHAAGTYTAAVRIGASGFALGDEQERDRRIAAWSGVLAGSARDGGALHRLQWIARCVPGGFDESAAPKEACDRGVASGSYRSLLEQAAPLLWRHEVLVSLSVRAGGGSARRRSQDTADRIVDELEALERRCLSAGLEVDGVLSPSALADSIRSSFAVGGAPRGVADGWPWPLGVEEGWSSVRTDATCHAIYWIAEWPRSGVGSGFLLPLMLEGGLRRTIAVTMAPVAPLRAVRRAEHDRTSGAADAELRRRHGFAVTARTRHEHEATTRREVELAEGHAAFRFTGYLAVTADDEGTLATACSRLEQAGLQAQLELHRMYGAQEEGYTCILPTGRGCA